jgi:group I intron endonuclease
MEFRINPEDKYKFGVYKITNGRNGRYYIGSTKQGFHTRFIDHRKTLRSGKHCNLFMCRDYNKDSSQFIFELLEITPQESTIEREQCYFDLFKIKEDNNCYNLFYTARGGGRPMPDYLKKMHSERMKTIWREKREFMLDALKKRPPQTDEHQEKKRIKMLGRKHKPESISKMMGCHNKKVKCLNNGLIFESLGQCAKSMGVSIGNLSSVCSGKLPHTKGYKFEYF